jgi:hypothetical protein
MGREWLNIEEVASLTFCGFSLLVIWHRRLESQSLPRRPQKGEERPHLTQGYILPRLLLPSLLLPFLPPCFPVLGQGLLPHHGVRSVGTVFSLCLSAVWRRLAHGSVWGTPTPKCRSKELTGLCYYMCSDHVHGGHLPVFSPLLQVTLQLRCVSGTF